MDKYLTEIKTKIKNIIPSYAILPLMLCVALNFGIYSGVRLFYKGRYFHDLTSILDQHIPVVPAFIVIYLGSYFFWITNYIIISRINREVCYKFLIADIIGKILCGIIYIVYPTTNIRPHILNSGIFNQMLICLYNVDAANNLFPSIHCLVSWYCFAGLRNCKDISKGYKVFSFIMAVMICISTLTTKQHVFVDVFSGIFIAEFTWQLSLRTELYRSYKYINQEA